MTDTQTLRDATPAESASAIRWNKQQLNYWMNLLGEHGDSFDEEGTEILAKIKFHNACIKAHILS